jgi:hypothetical protein
MNYTEIVEAALSFADRTDTETVAKIPVFVKMVESKINRVLRIQEVEVGGTIELLDGGNITGNQLPPDFSEMRGAMVYDLGAAAYFPMQYVTPKVFSDLLKNPNLPVGRQYASQAVYTISSNVLSTSAAFFTGLTAFIQYYKRVVPLTEAEPDNEISALYPDAYIAGIVFEISSFVKNPDAAAAWNGRFDSILNELTAQNWLKKWPASSLVTIIER